MGSKAMVTILRIARVYASALISPFRPSFSHDRNLRERVTHSHVFSFVRNNIPSVWALELLVLLHRTSDRSWSVSELVRELRGSESVILPCIEHLRTVNLVAGDPETGFRYAAATRELDATATELAKLYAIRPMALAKAIVRA
jgi:hypothetical protein